MIRAAVNGELDKVNTIKDAYFGLWIPEHCPGVPDDVLMPDKTWSNKADYAVQARKLVERFENNFAKYKGVVSDEILNSGPNL